MQKNLSIIGKSVVFKGNAEKPLIEGIVVVCVVIDRYGVILVIKATKGVMGSPIGNRDFDIEEHAIMVRKFFRVVV